MTRVVKIRGHWVDGQSDRYMFPRLNVRSAPSEHFIDFMGVELEHLKIMQDEASDKHLVGRE